MTLEHGIGKGSRQRCGLDSDLISGEFQSKKIIWKPDTVINMLIFPQIKSLHNPWLVMVV